MPEDLSPGDGEPIPAQREIEDDHDLLTYGEAGARLHEELEVLRRRVPEFEAAGDAEGLEAARSRLVILQEAMERLQSARISDENFERFFGYDGVAERKS